MKEKIKEKIKKFGIIETIVTAKKVTKPGEIVLLSPASASFDMFKNFADKGNKFKELVNKL